MTEKQRFPLKINGKDVNTIEELRDNFEPNTVYRYFSDGSLITWLRDRYYNDEADEAAKLGTNDMTKLCSVLGIVNKENVDPVTLRKRLENQEKLRQYTSDAKILDSAEFAVFSQDELFDILGEDVSTVYLCGEKFSVPHGRKNVHYIGISSPLVQLGRYTSEDYCKNSITFENVRFEEDGDFSVNTDKAVITIGRYTENNFVNQLLSSEDSEKAESLFGLISGDIFSVRTDIDADTDNMKRMIDSENLCEVGKRFIDSL